MEKKKFRISGKLIFNLAVVAISIYLIIYFFVSEDGLIDLLKKPDGCNMLIILAALLIYDLNILVDAVVTLIYVRSKYEDFSFIEALKVAFVGVFFSAITPSSTGGQPMQLYYMTKDKIKISESIVALTIVATLYKFVLVLIGIFMAVFFNGTLHKYLKGYIYLYYFGLALNAVVVAALLFLMINPRAFRKILIKCEHALVRIRILKPSMKRARKLTNIATE